MKITTTKERTLTIEADEGGFLLVERVRYVPRGYAKGKWDESRIWLSPEELRALVLLTMEPATSSIPILRIRTTPADTAKE